MRRQNYGYLPSQSITAVWPVLISRPAEGRRLSWPGWLGKDTRVVIPPKTSPIPLGLVTGPDVWQPRWYDQLRYRYAKPFIWCTTVRDVGGMPDNNVQRLYGPLWHWCVLFVGFWTIRRTYSTVEHVKAVVLTYTSASVLQFLSVLVIFTTYT